MTGKLQVMDLVSNAPMKFGIRRKRCAKLFDYLQNWKISRLTENAKPVAERNLPIFAPPKPTIADGLLIFFDVLKTDLQCDEYKKGMARCFVKVGQFPEDGAGGKFFYQYRSHEHSGLEKYNLLGSQVRIIVLVRVIFSKMHARADY